MLSAITFGPTRLLVEKIKDLSAELGDICVYKALTDYPGPHELVQLLNVFTPEVVFIEIGSWDLAANAVQEIRAGYPKTAVVGFAGAWDKEQDLPVKQAGVAEILLLPCSREEFHRTVVRATQARSSAVADNIIAFLPAKAGSGATTVALNVAAALRRDFCKRTLLLETDAQSGCLAALLDLEPPSSTIEALENSQWMSDAMWSRTVAQAQGLDLLPMPLAKNPSPVSRWEYQRLLTFVRARYDMIIADMPELADEALEAVVTQAKTLYVVANPEKSSLFLARRRIDELLARGAPDGHIQIVLNRFWQREDAHQALAQIQKELGRRIAVLLPDDESVWRSGNGAAPLIRKEAPLGAAIGSFACMLAGVKLPPPPPPPPEPKSGLRGLFRTLSH